MLTTRPLLAALTCTACLGLSGCGILIPSTVDRVRPGSSLRPAINPSFKADKMEHAIVRVLLVGSTRDKIEAFLAQNFRGVRYKVLTAAPRSRGDWLPWPSGPQIYFRPYEYEVWYSVAFVEVHLILDESERLKKVIVYRDNVSI